MTEPGASRVAVYVDFDNIVISYYDHVHGDGQFHKDRRAPQTLAGKAADAEVDLAAVLDYASSFGTLAQVRAYADWSRPENSGYREQLVGRSVELVQLFPAAAYGKNGADIRLAIDAVEDMFRLPDVTHVVIVAGDSDYVPLAQRLKRLNRTVVAVGVAGSTARSLVTAVDRFTSYQELPGLEAKGAEAAELAEVPVEPPARQPARQSHEENQQRRATNTLRRAMRLSEEDDDGWVRGSGLKDQMLRIDPTFSEKPLGFRSFTRFLESRETLVELDRSGSSHRVRLRG